MIRTNANYDAKNSLPARQPVVRIAITSYTRVFTNYVTGISGDVDWITEIDDWSLTISDLDGGSDLGTLAFVVQDVQALITADFPGFVFEGKKVTLDIGYPGLAASDYVRLFTGVVDSVVSVNGGNDYQFNCTDNKNLLSKVIFTLADDGFPTDSDHLRTLNGHPLDILINSLQNDIGIDPDFGANWAKIKGYRDTLFAGVQFTFDIDSPPVALDFYENEILKPLGGYLWVNAQGQIDVNFFAPFLGDAIFGGCCIGCFVDGTGQLVAAPFLVGLGCTLVVPPGATDFQMGVNDFNWGDNTGSWTFKVNGSTVVIGGNTAPWIFSGGVNSAYTFTNAGSSAPSGIPCTPGQTIVVTYVSGLCSLHLGVLLHDPLGQPSDTAPGSRPGDYAYSIAPEVAALFVFTEADTVGIPDAGQADLVNTISFRFDKNDTGFGSEVVESDDDSITKYGLYAAQAIESNGMRSGLQGVFLSALVARLIFLRYGDKNMILDSSGGASNGGSGIEVFWDGAIFEPGDLVAVTNAHIPDRSAGVRGLTAKLMEITDRSISFKNQRVSFTLLDSGINNIQISLVAPNGTPVYTSATAYQKGRYMFLCNNSDQYSNGDPAKVLA